MTLRTLLTNRQMPDDAKLSVTLGELRSAFAADPAPCIVERRLARLYATEPYSNAVAVALVCDEALDTSGALLGRIREYAKEVHRP
jgi:hypothetical protein